MVRVSAPNLLFRRLVNTTNLTLDTGLIPYERYTLGVAFQNQLLQGPEERIGFHMLQSSKTRRALSLVAADDAHMYTYVHDQDLHGCVVLQLRRHRRASTWSTPRVTS